MQANRIVRRRGSHIFYITGSQTTVRLSALPAGRHLSPGRFLVLISVKRLSRLQGHSGAGRIRSIEISSDLIGNRIRDLLACSIVPQPTMLPRASYLSLLYLWCNLFCMGSWSQDIWLWHWIRIVQEQGDWSRLADFVWLTLRGF
jgi:hypothetical protein